jgi:phosphohistidine phosphatase
MKTLILMRHAKSSWAEAGISDHDRPLNDRGKMDAPRAGEFLIERQAKPDLVLSSTAKRARKTARRVCESAGLDCEPQLADELYLAVPDEIVARLQELPDSVECVLLVGHNPGLSDLLAEWTGTQQDLPTAGTALLSLPVASWSELRIDTAAHLNWLWTPKD